MTEATTPLAATETKTKKVPKMSQVPHEDGAVEFKFNVEGEGEAIESQVYRLSDFPENVREGFAIFGMRTKLRNFTAQEADDKGEISSAQMAEKLKKGADLLKAGTWRVAREAGEKGATTTIVLEAALIYKRLKAEARGEVYEGSLTDVAKELETLTDEQMEQLKTTTLFKLALAEVKEQRAAAKKAALLAQAKKEAAEAAA